MHFVDTNVLIYAVSTLPDEIEKRNRARDLLTRRDLTLSTQVLSGSPGILRSVHSSGFGPER